MDIKAAYIALNRLEDELTITLSGLSYYDNMWCIYWSDDLGDLIDEEVCAYTFEDLLQLIREAVEIYRSGE